MYTWYRNETITAEKLNASQTRPYMETINKSGVAGGLDQTAIDPGSVLACFDECDPGSVEPVSRAEITEHEVGNMKYEWNPGGPIHCARGMGRWQIETGWSGVTGQEQKTPEGPVWLPNCSIENFTSGSKTAYVWDRITTNKWGTPMTVARVYDGCKTHETTIWSPSANEGGVVWRQMGQIKRSELDIGSRDATCYDTHIWEAVNYNSAVIMPVARPVGRSHWDSICISQSDTPDDYCRYSKAHYTPIAGNITGNTEPILSIGELGGTMIKLVNNCNDQQGIGIASGIEIYDCESYRACYNSDDTRPKFLRAAKATFNGGGWVQLEPIKNTKQGPGSPWQFKLTAGGGGGGGGTTCKANVCYCYCCTSEYAQTWNDNPPSVVNHTCGIMFGDVVRVINGTVCKRVNDETPALQYKPGEIRCGHLGIRTATWNDPGSYPATSTKRLFNRQGGLVTGIAEDIGAGCSLRPYIDKQGIIHVRSMECTDTGKGRYTPSGGTGGVVKVGRYTNAPLNYTAAMVTPFSWVQGISPQVIENQRCVGVLTGDVERVTGLTRTFNSQAWCEDHRAGVICNGKIGIGTAHYAWKSDYDYEHPHEGCICANNSGGLIIGIKNDSPCRWYIKDGFIHTPNPCWMGKYGVCIPCADAYIANPGGATTTSAYVFPSPIYDGFWVTCNKGKVNGKVVTIALNPDAAPTSWYPAGDAQTQQISMYTSYVLGEVKCGSIGIPTAFNKHGIPGSPTEKKCIWIPQFWACTVGEAWQPAGGLIRGIRMDIPAMCVQKDGKMYYGPIQLPYIDLNGVIHLPAMYMVNDCTGCSSWRPHQSMIGCGVPKYFCIKKGPHDDPGPIPPPPTPSTD